MPRRSSTSAQSVCRPFSAPPPIGNAPTLGPRVVRWIEENCVYGEGDRFGARVHLEPFQKHFLYHLYRVRPGTRERIYRRAMYEVPKGNGKTPLAAWIGAYELCHQRSPVIPVAAASYEQAELLFSDLRICASESPTLFQWLEPFENEIQRRDGPGRAFKVAAIAGTNDGARPSVFLADEVHEWTGNKGRVHLVLSNGTAKRANSLVLSTTTAGWDPDTLAGQLHDYGLRVNSGEIDDPAFLFVWYSAPDTFDLDDPEQLEAAVRAANPAAGSFLNVEDVIARYYQVPRHEFERYHLCRWTASGESWLPAGTWDACEDTGRTIADREQVVLGFDGSYSCDTTALVVVTLDDCPHIDVVGVWEKGENDGPDWRAPRLAIMEAIRQSCRRWKVIEIAADPYIWQSELEQLLEEKLPVVAFPQHAGKMIPATQRFYEMVMAGGITHSGDADLARHVANAVVKTDARGSRLAKDAKRSTRHIDLAVAAVMAVARAAEAPRPVVARCISLAAVVLEAKANGTWRD